MIDNDRNIQVRSVTERHVGTHQADLKKHSRDWRSVHIIDHSSKVVGNYTTHFVDGSFKQSNQCNEGNNETTIAQAAYLRNRHGFSANGHRIIKNTPSSHLDKNYASESSNHRYISSNG